MGWSAVWSSGVNHIKLYDNFSLLNEVREALNERSNVNDLTSLPTLSKLENPKDVMDTFQDRMDSIIPLMVKSNGPGFFNNVDTIPMWDESDLLTEISAVSRLSPDKMFVSADWLYQQYLMINELIWGMTNSVLEAQFNNPVSKFGDYEATYADAKTSYNGSAPGSSEGEMLYQALQTAGGQYRIFSYDYRVRLLNGSSYNAEAYPHLFATKENIGANAVFHGISDIIYLEKFNYMTDLVETVPASSNVDTIQIYGSVPYYILHPVAVPVYGSANPYYNQLGWDTNLQDTNYVYAVWKFDVTDGFEYI